MGLGKIRESVMGAAQGEATRAILAAKKHASERLDVQKEQVRQEMEREYAAKARVIDEDYARKLIQFKGAAGKQRLDKRNALVDDVFAQARKGVLAWKPEEYAAVMGRLLTQTASGLSGQVRVHADDKAVFAKLIAELNRSRVGQEPLTLDEQHTLPERGGFVLVTADFEVDQTLGTLLSDISHQLVPEIAAELFHG